MSIDGPGAGARRWGLAALLVLTLFAFGSTPLVFGQGRRERGHNHPRAADSNDNQPDRQQVLIRRFIRTVTLQDYNTRVVLLGTMLLGIAAGIVGTFMLLRRQALIGDVVSHAALPGVAIAFLVVQIATGDGRSLSWLLVGAAGTGFLAIALTSIIRRFSVIRPDASLAIVLGVFFGLGAVLFKAVQKIPAGTRAGLNQFILGSASTIGRDDVMLIGAAAVVVVFLCVAFFKELSILCFDEEFASAQGWPVALIDLALMLLVVGVTVIGLKAVGILMVAMLITPPTAARFWTENLGRMTIISAGIGGVSALLGSAASAVVDHLASGPTIVLTGTVFFVISLLFGKRRGLLGRWKRQRKTQRRIGQDDLLRAAYEIIESKSETPGAPALDVITATAVQQAELLKKRSWSAARIRLLIARAERNALLRMDPSAGWRLTTAGAREAQRAVRNHRLWEMFLITFADIAPSHVDRDADYIEHVLEPGVIEQLERELAVRTPQSQIPESPHAMHTSTLHSPST